MGLGLEPGTGRFRKRLRWGLLSRRGIAEGCQVTVPAPVRHRFRTIHISTWRILSSPTDQKYFTRRPCSANVCALPGGFSETARRCESSHSSDHCPHHPVLKLWNRDPKWGRQRKIQTGRFDFVYPPGHSTCAFGEIMTEVVMNHAPLHQNMCIAFQWVSITFHCIGPLMTNRRSLDVWMRHDETRLSCVYFAKPFFFKICRYESPPPPAPPSPPPPHPHPHHHHHHHHQHPIGIIGIAKW